MKNMSSTIALTLALVGGVNFQVLSMDNSSAKAVLYGCAGGVCAYGLSKAFEFCIKNYHSSDMREKTERERIHELLEDNAHWTNIVSEIARTAIAIANPHEQPLQKLEEETEAQKITLQDLATNFVQLKKKNDELDAHNTQLYETVLTMGAKITSLEVDVNEARAAIQELKTNMEKLGGFLPKTNSTSPRNGLHNRESNEADYLKPV